MLITFRCEACGDIMMFGEIAQRLLKMMGHSGTVPGAILAEDVPPALDRLKRAVELEKSAGASEPSVNNGNQEGDIGDQTVRLAHRALPLIELFEAAAKENCDVMWRET